MEPEASSFAVPAIFTLSPSTLIWPPTLPLALRLPLTLVVAELPRMMVPPRLLTESATSSPPTLITESRCLAARSALMAIRPLPTSICPELCTPPLTSALTLFLSPGSPPTAMLIRPSPWKSRVARGPVASLAVPFFAWMTPAFSTWAPSRATMPLSCTVIWPSLRTRPLSWRSSLPLRANSRACSSLTKPALATRALAEMRDFGPNQTPPGLTRISWPLEVMVP
ncbi:hypothetical protein FQZ97_863540 [compost metagenome]